MPEHCGRRAVLQHESKALARIVAIERHVGAARLQHGQQADDHVDAALDAQADPDVRADAQAAQVVGNPVRAAVYLRIGERVLAVGHGERVGLLCRARLEDLVRAEVCGKDCRCPVPIGEDAAAFGRGKDVDGGQGALGGPIERAEQAPRCLLHEAAHTFGADRPIDLRRQHEVLPEIVDLDRERVVGDPVEGDDLQAELRQHRRRAVPLRAAASSPSGSGATAVCR